MFVLFIYHFWTRNRQILNFEHFELILARFYSVKRAFSTKWWPGEENASKIIFFAFLVSFHINTTYIKLDWNSDNFLIFWCTLLLIYVNIIRASAQTPLLRICLLERKSRNLYYKAGINSHIERNIS